MTMAIEAKSPEATSVIAQAQAILEESRINYWERLRARLIRQEFQGQDPQTFTPISEILPRELRFKVPLTVAGIFAVGGIGVATVFFEAFGHSLGLNTELLGQVRPLLTAVAAGFSGLIGLGFGFDPIGETIAQRRYPRPTIWELE